MLDSMADREIDLETRCCKFAEKRGWQHGKLEKAKKGWPDRIFFGANCAFLLVEFKQPGEKPTKKQKHEHDKLRVLGHPVDVIDDYATFTRLMVGIEQLCLPLQLLQESLDPKAPQSARPRPDELH